MSPSNDNCMALLPTWFRILAVAIWFAFATPAHAGESPGAGDIVVVDARGDVRVTMRGEARAVQAGTIVELPATIRTGRDGSIELRQGATTVAVAPGTQLELPATANRGDSIDRLIQPLGNAFYNVGKRESRKLRVETPYLVAVIKGTQFNVAVQEDSTTISLFEGQLEVRAPDDSDVVDLNAGEIAIRHASDKTIRVLRMDSAKPPATAPNVDRTEGGQTGLAPSGPDDGGPVTPRAPSPIDDSLDKLITERDPAVTIDPLVGDNGGLVGISSSAVTAEVALGGGDGVVDAGADLDIGGIASAQLETEIDAAGESLDVSTGAQVDLGAAATDVGIDTGVDLGSGTAHLGADVGADLGVASIDAGLDAGVDLGAGSVDAGVDAGVDLGAAAVDAGVDAGVDLTAGSADAGVDTTIVGADVGADIGVDLGSGEVGLDVDLGGLDVGLDLGLGGDDTTATDTANTDTGSTDTGGGLLDGLLRPPGSN